MTNDAHDTAQAADRVTRAAAMRLQRISWDRIAEECGYADKAAAYNAVMRSMRRMRDETLADLKEQELAGYDRAAAAIWPKVLQGDARAQDTWLRNRERYSRMAGLDAPQRVQVSSSAVSDFDQALAEFMALVAPEDVAPVESP